MKYFLPLLLIAFFLGCSSKEQFRALVNNDTLYTNAIAYTKKATIEKDNQTVAYMTITYLNQLYPLTYSDKEYFLVGINIENAPNVLNDTFFLYLLENEYDQTLKQTITLNTTPATIEKANLNEFVNMPLQNRWSSYYLVSFNKNDSTDLKMQFGNETLGFKHFTIIKNRDK